MIHARATLPSVPLDLDLGRSGRHLAVALLDCEAGGVELRDATTLALIARFGAPRRPCRAALLADGGATLYYLANNDGRGVDLHRAEVATGADEVLTHYAGPGEAFALVANGDASSMAVLGRFAEVWDLKAGHALTAYAIHEGAGPNHRLAAAFSARDTLFLAGHRPAEVVELAGDALLGRWPAPPRPGRIELSPDGLWISVTGGLHTGARLYHLPTGDRIGADWVNEGLGSPALPFTDDGRLLWMVAGRPWLFTLPGMTLQKHPALTDAAPSHVVRAREAEVFAMASETGELHVFRLSDLPVPAAGGRR